MHGSRANAIRVTAEGRNDCFGGIQRRRITMENDLREPLKMPSVAFLETEMKKCDFSFSSTDVLKNGSMFLCCAGASNF